MAGPRTTQPSDIPSVCRSGRGMATGSVGLDWRGYSARYLPVGPPRRLLLDSHPGAAAVASAAGEWATVQGDPGAEWHAESDVSHQLGPASGQGPTATVPRDLYRKSAANAPTHWSQPVHKAKKGASRRQHIRDVGMPLLQLATRPDHPDLRCPPHHRHRQHHRWFRQGHHRPCRVRRASGG